MRYILIIFNIITGLASIASFVIFTILHREQEALLIFHIFLFSLLISYILFKIYELNLIKKENFQFISIYQKWIIINKKEARYEAFMIVKSNRPYLSHVEIKNTWTGKGDITVISENKHTSWNTSGKNIIIKYPVELYMNEYRAIHYTIDTVDTSGEQCPILKCGGKNPVKIFILEVVLPNRTEMPDAKIFETDIGQPYQSGQQRDKVPFNQFTMSYRWKLLDFPGNRDYWMVWED